MGHQAVKVVWSSLRPSSMRIRLQVYVLQAWFRAWLLVCLLLDCFMSWYWLVVLASWMNIFTTHFVSCLSSGISSKSSENEPPEPKTQGRPRWQPRLPKPLQIHQKSSPRTSGSYFWCYFVDLRFWTTVQRIWWFFRFWAALKDNKSTRIASDNHIETMYRQNTIQSTFCMKKKCRLLSKIGSQITRNRAWDRHEIALGHLSRHCVILTPRTTDKVFQKRPQECK